MNKHFGDQSISIHCIQQKLNELYNSDIYVTGEYYKTFDMNYGFAHFVAKYLDREFPVLDSVTKEEYSHIPDTDEQRSLSKPISVLNYFLCNNNGEKLRFDDAIYKSIYNEYMRVHKSTEEGHYGQYEPIYRGKYMIKNDLPLFTTYNSETGTYSVNDNIIFNMSPWTRKKEICEIDDYIASFLFGQTITPKSSMEDIYYVQKLLIGEDNISRDEKGVWNYVRPDGRTLTDIIIDFQKRCVSKYGSVPIIVTGYFDIFTENAALSQILDGGGINVTGL
jgi:hypothetical protein